MHDSIDTDFEESASFFEWGHKEFRVDHPLFMNDLKLLAKNKDQTDSLVPTVHCTLYICEAKWSNDTSKWTNDEKLIKEDTNIWVLRKLIRSRKQT